ncbi:MAG: CDP-diacylglycerol--glycerol-3-phosphate 3-phosphatidyltransferase [Candidatus Puniceispirillaceae bacterium]
MYRQIPNILTVLRLVAAPVVALILIGTPTYQMALFALCLYAIASATDWLDGYLARRWQSVSVFGRMLDPIADKLMVVIMLMALMGTTLSGMILAVPAIAIVTREILVSGLREFMAKSDVVVHVTWAAKLKTTTQLIAIGFLIGTFLFDGSSDAYQACYMIGMIGIWFAAILTVQTGYSYFKAALSQSDT